MRVVSIAGALTALSLVVIAGGAQAGDKSATPDAAPPVLAAEATDGGAPLTLYVEGPTGANFRLIYRVGEGWRFADRIAADGRLSLALDRGLVPAMAEAITTEEPQTVFIDGPTGNIFVWFLDRGWQFVGHIAEAEAGSTDIYFTDFNVDTGSGVAQERAPRRTVVRKD